MQNIGMGQAESMWFENLRFLSSRKAKPVERPPETGTVLRTDGSDGAHESGALVDAVDSM